ncbi:transposase, partial [Pseudomonas alliivorans]|nr:transposase [Pseudomonas alliivorans]
MAKRYELPDAAWDLVADIFSEPRRKGRPRADDRLMLNGVRWVLCSGAAWR